MVCGMARKIIYPTCLGECWIKLLTKTIQRTKDTPDQCDHCEKGHSLRDGCFFRIGVSWSPKTPKVGLVRWACDDASRTQLSWCLTFPNLKILDAVWRSSVSCIYLSNMFNPQSSRLSSFGALLLHGTPTRNSPLCRMWSVPHNARGKPSGDVMSNKGPRSISIIRAVMPKEGNGICSKVAICQLWPVDPPGFRSGRF